MVQSPFRAAHGFNDLPPSPVIAVTLGSSAPTLANLTTTIPQYTFDATNDFIIVAAEITHDYHPGTNIEAHVHWIPNGTNVDDRYVEFQLIVAVLREGAAVSAEQTLVTGDLLIPAGTAVYDVNAFTDLIDGSLLNIGDYIVGRFSRIAADGTAPTGDPFVIAVGFHAEMNSTGSITRYTK